MKPSYALTLLIAVMLCALPAQAQDASISISLPDVTGVQPGDTIDVAVRVDDEIDEDVTITAYQFNITYDPAVLDFTGAFTTSGTLSENKSISTNGTPQNRINLALSTSMSNPIEGGPADLVVLEAVVLSSGQTNLSFEDVLFEGFGEVTSEATDGSVTAGTGTSSLIINELLYDPPPGDDDGDANNDGARDGSEDEFIEILNTSDLPITLDGYTISDGIGVRHTFPVGTVVNPGEAAVVFGGGTPTGIPGVVQTASSGLLGFNNGDDVAILRNAADEVVTLFSYGEDGNIVESFDGDESLARNPDGTGIFVAHSTIDRDGDDTADGDLYSPGFENAGTEPLPVELVAFSGRADGQSVVLSWQTASETNNRGFYVEQRINGAFAEVGFEAGAGTSVEARSYQHRIEDLTPGTHTFRLRQEDRDGQRHFSDTETVTVGLAEAFALSKVAPNPFRSRTSFGVRVREAQTVRIALYNTLGQRVQQLYDGSLRPDREHTITIDGSALPSGLYFYRVQGESFSTAHPVTLVK